MQSAFPYGNSDSTREVRLAGLAAKQHGVVSFAQLRALGYSTHAIYDRVAQHRLNRLHRGVYAVGHTKISLRARWLAATMACGSQAVLSHRAAAALHELRAAPYGPIDVTATSRHDIDGIRCHRVRALAPEDSIQIDGIPVTTIARLFLDLAEQLPARQFHVTLEAAQRADLLNVIHIKALIERSPGRHGAKPLSEAIENLEDEPPWTQSELERRFRALTQSSGLPQPQFNVLVDELLVDCFWPQHNLVVEVDGWTFHKTRQAFEADRRKDAQLVTAGRRVLRLTHRRLRDEARAVARELGTLLSAGTASASGRSDR